jgi:hypothetical protein
MTKKIIQKQKQAPASTGLHIYKLAAPEVSERKVLQLAKKFTLGGNNKTGTLSQKNDMFMYEEGGHILTVCRKSGAYRILNKLSWQADDRKSNLDMKEDAAIKIAEKYIKKYNLVSLKECRFLKIARLVVGEREMGAEKGTERIIAMDVAFHRVIDKTPVDGPGGKVIISIGQDSKVNGCTVLWRKIQKRERAVSKLITNQSAIEEANHYWAEEKQRITIRNTRFGYFEEGWNRPQKYLQPAHIIFVTLGTARSRFTRKSVYVVPAALNNTGRITPQREKKRRQAGRKEIKPAG